jgi:hypothetical protein
MRASVKCHVASCPQSHSRFLALAAFVFLMHCSQLEHQKRTKRFDPSVNPAYLVQQRVQEVLISDD